jgi:hypothetical protein
MEAIADIRCLPEESPAKLPAGYNALVEKLRRNSRRLLSITLHPVDCLTAYLRQRAGRSTKSRFTLGRPNQLAL